MGAKFTIVLDTDDQKGLRDALDIAVLLNKSAGNSPPSGMANLSKIQTIKLVRLVAKRCEWGKMDSSLTASKNLVDAMWHDLTTTGKTPDYIS